MNRTTFLQFRSGYVTCVPIPTLIQVRGAEGHRYSGRVPHVPLVHYAHALECWVSAVFWLLASRRSEDLHMKCCLLLDLMCGLVRHIIIISSPPHADTLPVAVLLCVVFKVNFLRTKVTVS